jgi:hypothetical protein
VDHLNRRDYRPGARNCKRNSYLAALFVGQPPYKPVRESDLDCRM